jgi:hypothetical protein
MSQENVEIVKRAEAAYAAYNQRDWGCCGLSRGSLAGGGPLNS